MTKSILPIFLFLIFFSCKNNNNNNQKPIDPFESAMPHGESLPDAQLSEQDKSKLANAKGRSTISINENQLDSLFSNSKDILHIYSFYKVDDQNCTQLNNHLLSLQKKLGEESFDLVFFNIDPPQNKSKVVTQLRQSGVTSDIFAPSNNIDTNWFSKVNPNWAGEIPAIYLVNQSDGTSIFYQKEFTEDELMALVQPFIM